MMKYAVAALLAWLAVFPAMAQSLVTAVPWQVTGFATLSATNASALLSTATVGPNSVVWPISPQMMYVTNSPASSGTAYICPLGGTCSASVGIPIAAGSSYGFFHPATAMTVISASTSTIIAQWGN